MTVEQMTKSIQLSNYLVDLKRSRFGRALLLKKSLAVSNYPIIQLILKVVDFEGFEKYPKSNYQVNFCNNTSYFSSNDFTVMTK